MIVSAEHLSVAFDGRQLFSDLTFDIAKGEKMVFSGESGSGKTTLLNILTGIEQHYHGEVRIFGQKPVRENIHHIRSQIAWLPQEVPAHPGTTEEMLFMPFQFKQNKHLRPDIEKVNALLFRLGLSPAILSKQVKSISGGEKQRIALALCLLLERPLLLLDEPTSALDETSIKKVTSLLFEKKGMTVVSTSHNITWINTCDQQIAL